MRSPFIPLYLLTLKKQSFCLAKSTRFNEDKLSRSFFKIILQFHLTRNIALIHICICPANPSNFRFRWSDDSYLGYELKTIVGAFMKEIMLCPKMRVLRGRVVSYCIGFERCYRSKFPEPHRKTTPAPFPRAFRERVTIFGFIRQLE